MSPGPSGGLPTVTVLIVTGWLRGDPEQRDAYVQQCRAVVEQARGTQGCLDFAITACSVDPARVVVGERWTSRQALDAFRGGGVSDEQGAQVLDAAVDEYVTDGGTRL